MKSLFYVQKWENLSGQESLRMALLLGFIHNLLDGSTCHRLKIFLWLKVVFKQKKSPFNWANQCHEAYCLLRVFNSFSEWEIWPFWQTRWLWIKPFKRNNSVSQKARVFLTVSAMRNTYYLIQVKFITDYTNVQHIIITQI